MLAFFAFFFFGIGLGGLAIGALHLTDGPVGAIIFASSLITVSIAWPLTKWVIRYGGVRFSPSVCLAKVESARATGEGPDVTLLLDLTVSPKGYSSFRANSKVKVNLCDIQSWVEGKTIVVEYSTLQRWRVRVLSHNSESLVNSDSNVIETASEETREIRLPISPELVIFAIAGFFLGSLVAVYLSSNSLL
ncbi:hypothetical protein [Streptomyces sp. NPDC055109]